ncbi:MAG: cation diffusion facilitator family transporter [Thermoplasmata archaeon]|nr:cation diffusion facilitator family transporter [Thermoplasmata archaeon]
MSAHGGRKAIIAAFFANLGIMIAKIIGFIFTGAASMLAEAVHSFADTSNQALLLMGGKLAEKKATSEHPFGYGRERYFWSFIVAMIIFTLGSLFAIYEGWNKLAHDSGHGLDRPEWAIGILLVAIVLESFSFRTAIIESRPLKGDMTWWEFIKHSKVPELPVVLLEDLGALVGMIIALIGIGLAMVTGDAKYDAMGSLAIGILLGIIAIVLAIEMRSLLLGESATTDMIETITCTVKEQDGVEHLINLKTQHIGPEELLVAIKVEFDNSLTSDDIAKRIDIMEVCIREKVPIAKRIFVEPGVFDKERK